MYFSGLNGYNKDLSGFELSYHSGSNDLIAEVYQMLFYSHKLNDILIWCKWPICEDGDL